MITAGINHEEKCEKPNIQEKVEQTQVSGSCYIFRGSDRACTILNSPIVGMICKKSQPWLRILEVVA